MSPTHTTAARPQTVPVQAGEYLMRYALVLIIAWAGLLHFGAVQAEGIRPLVEESPWLAWVYGIFTPRAFAVLLGLFELGIALALALRPVSPALGLVGSVGAIILFVITLSFLFTTPGVWAEGAGFPVFSPLGFNLFKDLLFLCVAVWSALEALSAVRHRSAHRPGTEPLAGERRHAYP